MTTYEHNHDRFVIEDEYGAETHHEKGNVTCLACWEEYPLPCRCGGLVHAIYLDEDDEDTICLARKCDTCGNDYSERYQ